MIPIPEKPQDFPGQQRVAWRREPHRIVLAAIAGAMWPPIPITLLIWPPNNWGPSLEVDLRLVALFIGVIAVPAGLWLLSRERERTGRPSTRLGVVWRFMFYGGLLAAALQALFALVLCILGWFEAGGIAQAAGATETTLLIYGVGLLPVAVMVGVSYALWAGLCAAFIAFMPQPEVRDRLGVMVERDGA
ncbi:MAG: phthalate transporter [Brevundimonas sp.]|uniref:phthalate transporter n=1 Tax=Brevundimonas sp. TaxID=1871086 RepID=UPI002722FE6C|nr:phthalate transporter [Brevundimonas sp.]MDO9589243.1 phthalate transporter [Brevundimonas sp.]MDP3368579.1 phthalate transporter [Brevundimonas sp.]MDP3655451.1 phthalate transporter [Brevundimonas sp.]MDZ4112030.1 phthalate transporter [Brevundimonas sp.]